MSWEFLRDLGLVAFAYGAVAFSFIFLFGRFLTRHIGSSDIAFVATVADAIMLAGASLAVTAIAVGYLVSNASPS